MKTDNEKKIISNEAQDDKTNDNDSQDKTYHKKRANDGEIESNKLGITPHNNREIKEDQSNYKENSESESEQEEKEVTNPMISKGTRRPNPKYNNFYQFFIGN